MFVATTLALSLVVSPVTALMQAPPTTQRPAVTSAPAPSTAPAAAPAPVAAATPASKPAGTACVKLDYRAVVVVDATTLGADAQGVATRLRSKAEQELQRNDIMLGTAESAVPRIVVKVVPLPGEDGGYSFTIDITHVDTSPVKDGSSVGECPLCTESELLEKIVGATRALAPKLRAYVADYNNKPCGCNVDIDCKDPALPTCNKQRHVCEPRSAEPECRTDTDCKGNVNGDHCHEVTKKCVPGTSSPPPPGGLSGKQKVGVGLLAVGAVGVGVGIGLMVKKPVADAPDMAWSYTTTRPPGIALLAVGGVAVASGIVLFILGRRPAPPRNQVTPVAGAGFYGLSWSGRF
jgi:hypothetical protein